VKIALALSVALNLAVAGLAVGAWLGDGPHRGMPRDMSFGPFSEALDDTEDRRAIRRAFMERRAISASSARRRGPSSRPCLPPCAPIPFDPAALKAALAALEARNADRLDLGRSADRDPAGRDVAGCRAAAFADRLEKRAAARAGKD
jgi:hypothetical protein